ncbi:NifU family protein [bacterium]|nr:NifU family protein [bacterium]
MREKIERILEQSIQPKIAPNGCSVELVEIADNNLVLVRVYGACECCPLSRITLLMFIEKELKLQIPEISKVELG